MSSLTVHEAISKLNAENREDVLLGLAALASLDTKNVDEYLTLSPLAFEVTQNWSERKAEAIEIAAISAIRNLLRRCSIDSARVKLAWALLRSEYVVERVNAMLKLTEASEAAITFLHTLAIIADQDPGLAREVQVKVNFAHSVPGKLEEKRLPQEKAKQATKKKLLVEYRIAAGLLVSNTMAKGDENARRMIFDSPLVDFCFDGVLELPAQVVNAFTENLLKHAPSKVLLTGKCLGSLARCSKSHEDELVRQAATDFLLGVVKLKGDKARIKLMEYLDPIHDERHALLLEACLSGKTSLADYFESKKSSVTLLEPRPTFAWVRTISLVCRLLMSCKVADGLNGLEDAKREVVPPEASLSRPLFLRMISHTNALVRLYGLDLLIHMLHRAVECYKLLPSSLDRQGFSDYLAKRVPDASTIVGGFKSDASSSEQTQWLFNRSLRALELYAHCGILIGTDPLRFIANLGLDELTNLRVLRLLVACERSITPSDWLGNVKLGESEEISGSMTYLGFLVEMLFKFLDTSVPGRTVFALACKALQRLSFVPVATDLDSSAILLNTWGEEELISLASKEIVRLACTSQDHSKCFNIALTMLRKNKRADFLTMLMNELDRHKVAYVRIEIEGILVPSRQDTSVSNVKRLVVAAVSMSFVDLPERVFRPLGKELDNVDSKALLALLRHLETNYAKYPRTIFLAVLALLRDEPLILDPTIIIWFEAFLAKCGKEEDDNIRQEMERCIGRVARRLLHTALSSKRRDTLNVATSASTLLSSEERALLSITLCDLDLVECLADMFSRPFVQQRPSSAVTSRLIQGLMREDQTLARKCALALRRSVRDDASIVTLLEPYYAALVDKPDLELLDAELFKIMMQVPGPISFILSTKKRKQIKSVNSLDVALCSYATKQLIVKRLDKHQQEQLVTDAMKHARTMMSDELKTKLTTWMLQHFSSFEIMAPLLSPDFVEKDAAETVLDSYDGGENEKALMLAWLVSVDQLSSRKAFKKVVPMKDVKDWSLEELELVVCCLDKDAKCVKSLVRSCEEMAHQILADYSCSTSRRDLLLFRLLHYLDASPSRFGFAFGAFLLPLEVYQGQMYLNETYMSVLHKQMNWVSEGLDSARLRTRPFDDARSYDPRHLLNVFDFYLGVAALAYSLSHSKDDAGSAVESEVSQINFPSRRWVLHGHVDFILYCLAHEDEIIRTKAYSCLQRFAQLTSRTTSLGAFRERDEFLLVLTRLRESVEEPFQRLPLLTVVFCQEFIHVCCRVQASHAQFSRVNAFLLAEESTLDLKDIPLFMQNFHSGSPAFEHDRAWVLHVISRGIASSKDLGAINRRFVIESCFDLFASSRSDHSARKACLNVLKAIARIKGDSGANALIQRGLLAFCITVLEQASDTTPIWRLGDDRGEDSRKDIVSDIAELLLIVAERRVEFATKVALRDVPPKRSKAYLGCEWTAMEADWALSAPKFMKFSLRDQRFLDVLELQASMLRLNPSDVLPYCHGENASKFIRILVRGDSMQEKGSIVGEMVTLVARECIESRHVDKITLVWMERTLQRLDSLEHVSVGVFASLMSSCGHSPEMVRLSLTVAMLKVTDDESLKGNNQIKILMSQYVPRLWSTWGEDQLRLDWLAFIARTIICDGSVDQCLQVLRRFDV